MGYEMGLREVSHLTKKQFQVLMLRYGTEETPTFQEVGEGLGFKNSPKQRAHNLYRRAEKEVVRACADVLIATGIGMIGNLEDYYLKAIKQIKEKAPEILPYLKKVEI